MKIGKRPLMAVMVAVLALGTGATPMMVAQAQEGTIHAGQGTQPTMVQLWFDTISGSQRDGMAAQQVFGWEVDAHGRGTLTPGEASPIPFQLNRDQFTTFVHLVTLLSNISTGASEGACATDSAYDVVDWRRGTSEGRVAVGHTCTDAISRLRSGVMFDISAMIHAAAGQTPRHIRGGWRPGPEAFVEPDGIEWRLHFDGVEAARIRLFADGQGRLSAEDRSGSDPTRVNRWIRSENFRMPDGGYSDMTARFARYAPDPSVTPCTITSADRVAHQLIWYDERGTHQRVFSERCGGIPANLREDMRPLSQMIEAQLRPDRQP